MVYFLQIKNGRVAQLVEHYLDMVVVEGSSPFVATIFMYMYGFYALKKVMKLV